MCFTCSFNILTTKKEYYAIIVIVFIKEADHSSSKCAPILTSMPAVTCSCTFLTFKLLFSSSFID